MSDLGAGEIYTSVVLARNTEATLRWSRAQIFLVINSSGIAVVPIILSDKYTLAWRYPAVLVLGIFGLILSTLWVLVTNRANVWIDFWNSRLIEIETSTKTLAELRVFSHERFRQHNWQAPSFHHTLVWLAGSFALLWLLVCLVGLILTVTSKIGA